MAYPTDSDISTWASTNAADPEPTYAFSTVYGRTPLTPQELTGWWSSTLSDSRFAGITDANLIAAYLINNRGFPPTSAIAIAWLQGQGYYANGQPTGQEPQVGQGYDQSVGLNTISATPAPSSTAAGGSTVTPGPDIVSTITSEATAHPVIAGVVGLGVAYGLYKIVKGGRR